MSNLPITGRWTPGLSLSEPGIADRRSCHLLASACKVTLANKMSRHTPAHLCYLYLRIKACAQKPGSCHKPIWLRKWLVTCKQDGHVHMAVLVAMVVQWLCNGAMASVWSLANMMSAHTCTSVPLTYFTHKLASCIIKPFDWKIGRSLPNRMGHVHMAICTRCNGCAMVKCVITCSKMSSHTCTSVLLILALKACVS